MCGWPRFASHGPFVHMPMRTCFRLIRLDSGLMRRGRFGFQQFGDRIMPGLGRFDRSCGALRCLDRCSPSRGGLRRRGSRLMERQSDAFAKQGCGMPAVLQHERIDRNRDRQAEDQRAEDSIGIGGQAIGETQDCAKGAEESSPRRRFAGACRLRKDEIMIAAGQSFTQFSSPSFQCRIGTSHRRPSGARSFRSWPCISYRAPIAGNRAASAR